MTVLLSVLGLLAVAALTLGTAISVASEFALTALERSHVDAHVAEVGDRRARAVQRAHRTLSFQLSGSQLGITVTTLVTGYIAEPAIASLFRPGLAAVGLSPGLAAGTATVLSLLLATALSMVFGELVPKNLAIAGPMRTARAVVWVQSAFAHAFRWLIDGLNSAANAIVRRLGVEPAEELRSARSARELSSLVRASAQHGTLDAGTATLLDRSLRFTDRVADELMTPRV
ncbi:MAG: CNNM domain-containing protein, partial [Pseudonocardia sp.]